MGDPCTGGPRIGGLRWTPPPEARVIALVGETGSGKSEIALEMAIRARRAGRSVRFYDLDQTKPIFRSRERAALLADLGIAVELGAALLDAPVVGEAIVSRIGGDGDELCVVDAGGGAPGARMLASMSAGAIGGCIGYLAVNPWRALDPAAGGLCARVAAASAAARIGRMRAALNPNLGAATAYADVAAGMRAILESGDGAHGSHDAICDPVLLVVEGRFEDALRAEFPGHEVLALTRRMTAPWECSGAPSGG